VSVAVADLILVRSIPPVAVTKSIDCRLAYLISPRPELFGALALPSSSQHDVCKPVAVITPILDYEEWFEGWKRSWLSKAKEDFVAEFLSMYADQFPAFKHELCSAPPVESFDRWWTISLIDVIDINPSWRPS
jgi:hypothetical protein